MGHSRWCTWIGCIHLLILVGDTQGASTVYARLGETAMLSWDLPSTGLETFIVTFNNEEIFRVTNYNLVTVVNSYRKWKREFVGNITPSGTGVFSFMLHDVDVFDAGHYRCYRTSFNTTAAEVPGCGQRLVVLDIQQPYIGALHTALMDRSVTLSCYSNYKSYFEDVNASIKWRRNGLLLDESSEYNITHENCAWPGWRCHRGTLTVSDVSKHKGDNFQCQAVFGPMVSGWSEVYALVKQSGSYENYTVVREGHSALINLKMPLADEDFLIRAPGYGMLFDVDPPRVAILSTYRTRVSITKVTTSADSVVVQFWLHNARSEDAGKYFCDRWYRNPIPDCQHMLYLGKPAHPNISVIVNTANIVLTCETKSSIVPLDHDIRMIYTWQRNGQEVESVGRFHASGQILAVTDVKKEDLGNYSCQATEGDLASNFSDEVDLQILTRPQVGELTVNGTEYITVKENQVVVFSCMVQDYLSPAVSLVQENSLASVNMSRTQQNVYEHVMVARQCSQLGMYSCRARNVAGTSEGEQRSVVLKGMPRKEASHVFVTNGKTPSIVINTTLCSYPRPSKPKWRFAQSGQLRDITDRKKYHLATENMKHNVLEYSLVINNITDADFGVYYFSVEYNHSSTVFIFPASRITDTPEANLPLVVGSSVAAVIVTLGIIAGLILSRLNQLRDYWNLRFRSCMTPMQNMPENIDDREYAEIDDADLPERGAGNIVQPVFNVPDDNNIPPACGARNRRERQQPEGEDDEYEEVRPLEATNREQHPTEQEKTAEMQQPDKDIKEDIKDEITHSEPRIVVADWSAEGRKSRDMAAAILYQLAETSFVTQEPDETDTDKLPTASRMYSGIDGIKAIEAEADDPFVEGEDFAESEPLDLPCNRYESLISHQPQDTYTALDNDDGITHDLYSNMCHKYCVKPVKEGNLPKQN